MVRSTRRDPPKSLAKTSAHPRRSVSPEKAEKSENVVSEGESGDHSNNTQMSMRTKERKTSMTKDHKMDKDKLPYREIEDVKIVDESRLGEPAARTKSVRTRRGHLIEKEADGMSYDLPIATRRRKSQKPSEKVREGYDDNVLNTAEDADTESPTFIAEKNGPPHEMDLRTTDTDTEMDKPTVKEENALSGTALLKKEQLTTEFTSLKQIVLDEEIAELDKEIASIQDGNIPSPYTVFIYTSETSVGRHLWLQEQYGVLDGLLNTKMQLSSCRKLAEIQNILHKYDAMEHDITFQRHVSIQDYLLCDLQCSIV
jgi:hypothetical protein